jgi:DnaJ-class molecular chaperone
MMKSFTETITCPHCNGAGEVEVECYSRASNSTPYGDIYTKWEECDECNGSGQVDIEDSE